MEGACIDGLASYGLEAVSVWQCDSCGVQLELGRHSLYCSEPKIIDSCPFILPFCLVFLESSCAATTSLSI
jgi:hypothetical protein